MPSGDLRTAGESAAGAYAPVVVGAYEIGVGEAPGMAIRASDALTPAAARNEKALSAAFSGSNEPKPRPGAVDDVEDVSEQADEATTQVERAETLALQAVQNGLSVSALNNELDSMLALLQRLDSKKRFDKQLRLARARAISPLAWAASSMQP